MMTEDDARGRTCHMTMMRPVGMMHPEGYATIEIQSEGCIGCQCMAWTWKEPEQPNTSIQSMPIRNLRRSAFPDEEDNVYRTESEWLDIFKKSAQIVDLVSAGYRIYNIVPKYYGGVRKRWVTKENPIKNKDGSETIGMVECKEDEEAMNIDAISYRTIRDYELIPRKGDCRAFLAIDVDVEVDYS